MIATDSTYMGNEQSDVALYRYAPISPTELE